MFPDVRSFEHFKYLHIGLVSELKRKTLPAISQAVGLRNAQGLHHFLTESPWDLKSLQNHRLELLKKALQGKSFILCIDETGDRKKGKSTDYVARQYIGNLGKAENEIVTVNAYGIFGTTVFPITFKIFKLRSRLKENDQYRTKPEIAVEILNKLKEWGFNFDLVLVDSLYGDSSGFITTLRENNVNFIVAIRSNHGVWLAPGQRVRSNCWKEFSRVFSNGDCQKRYIREIFMVGDEMCAITKSLQIVKRYRLKRLGCNE
ncbi:MAG: IS701 family transposase [Synechococcus sp.]